MCRPPDHFSQLSNPTPMSVETAPAPVYASQNIDFPSDVYGINDGWEQDMTDEANLQGSDYGWDWSQQVQASGVPYIPANSMDQVTMQSQNRRPVMAKHPRVRVNSGVNMSPSLMLPSVYPNSWKYQQMYQDGQTAHPLPWTGTSVAYPAMQYPPPPSKPSSLMAGPSVVGPAGRRMISNAPNSVGKWVKTSPPAAQAGQYSLQAAAKKEIALQEKPWENIVEGPVDEAEEGDCAEDNASDDDDALKEKKMRRMLSNRASAKRSRQRRQERLGELEILTAKLRVENATINRKYTEAMEQIEQYQRENASLSHELESVRSQLDSLKVNKDGCSNQDSGKASVQSRYDAEDRHEVHSLKKELNISPSVGDQTCIKTSPVSEVTRDCKAGDHCHIPKEVVLLDEDNIEIGSDDWFENLVHCLDD